MAIVMLPWRSKVFVRTTPTLKGRSDEEDSANSGPDADVRRVGSSCPPIVLTFEGLKDQEQVLNYYNRGLGGSGSAPAPTTESRAVPSRWRSSRKQREGRAILTARRACPPFCSSSAARAMLRTWPPVHHRIFLLLQFAVRHWFGDCLFGTQRYRHRAGVALASVDS
jgi:hypothetical protein